MSFLNKYRVDNVPLCWKPIFLIYAYGFGIINYLYAFFIHLTCKIEIEYEESLGLSKNYIYCFWHESWRSYFSVFLKHKKHSWMNHPAWYMKPVHVAMRFVGIEKIVLGSSGNLGKEAADKLIKDLMSGYSTVVLPDGPYGPPKVLKKGVLFLSLQSGVPVIPMAIKVKRCIRLNNWDRQKMLIPFLSTIRVQIKKPILVTKKNFKESSETLPQQLE